MLAFVAAPNVCLELIRTYLCAQNNLSVQTHVVFHTSVITIVMPIESRTDSFLFQKTATTQQNL